MKKYYSFFLLIFVFFSLQAQQRTVTVGNANSTYIKIIDIQNWGPYTEIALELNPTSTINGTLHAPTGKSPFVLSDQRGNRYALKDQIGWQGPDSDGYGSVSLTIGKKKFVKLFFDKLSDLKEIYSLTELNCTGNGCWNFYEISVKEKTTSTEVSKKEVSTDYKRSWADYDVYENNKKGMRIHTEFSVYNLKDVTCYLTIRFMNKKDEFLTTENKTYKNSSGQIALYKKLNPQFEKTAYDDVKVFIPYSELNLGLGYHDLKYDVDLIYEDGTLIKHFDIKNFYYDNK